ncbi:MULTISPECIES: hypothetical protein [Paraburkholderia]|uniref:hypothetical protein n=1 Tax=Paraburkholderia TaxID=1822464 RepID=UPI000B48E184|nr:hypothetical protein BWU74_10230 [Burkholderia sp. Bk]
MTSLQQIFIAVRSHLLAQMAVSEDDSGSCRLRGRDGRRCAIGALIHDEHYSPALEEFGIGYYQAGEGGPLLRALAMSGVNAYEPRVIALLQDLEDVHDEGDVARWHEQFEDVARRHLHERAVETAAWPELAEAA